MNARLMAIIQNNLGKPVLKLEEIVTISTNNQHYYRPDALPVAKPIVSELVAYKKNSTLTPGKVFPQRPGTRPLATS